MDNVVELSAVASFAHKIYHSDDNIAELCIRLRLRASQHHGSGESAVPKEPEPFGAQPSAASQFGEARPGELPDVVGEETEEFRWQQLVLGFHQTSEAVTPDARQGRRFFSRCTSAGKKAAEDEPPEVPQRVDASDETSARFTPALWAALTPAKQHLMTICRRLRCCHRRTTIARNFGDLWEEKTAMYEQMRLYCILDVPAGSTSDMSEDDDFGPTRFEVLLCELRASEGGRILEVQPPFSAIAGTRNTGPAATGDVQPPRIATSNTSIFPYHFELPGGKSYEYAVENISYIPTEAERHRAAEAEHVFDTCALQMRKNLAGTGFDSLGNAAVQFAVVGEICSFEPTGCRRTSKPDSRNGNDRTGFGRGWEFEALLRRTTPVPFHTVLWRPSFYIVYELSLPRNGEWEVIGGGSASGISMSTQFTSLSGCWTQQKRCIFNQPLDLHLAHNPPTGTALDGLPPDPLPPRLVLQVFQVGSWDRHNLHGYTFVDIPRLPGEYDLHVPLWTPLGTITQQLNAKLCGAYMPLASPHLVALADMHQRNMLPRNRSALRAQTAAGTVSLHLKVLRRRRPQSSLLPGDMNAISSARLALEEMSAMQPSERLEGLRRRRAARARRAAENEASGLGNMARAGAFHP